ncbi:Ankyrin repeat protein [Hibiscus syriacus]|uniref:Ankyrin repeat protein n=1 Tax=Hibiscus syriacus TaxID=106335 RepID=A0A6A3BIQ7_HIBSY|nr:Ankyrin repeat protein [Hibiscus syriacus]
MLGAELCSRAFSTHRLFLDSSNAYHPTPSFSFHSLRFSSIPLHLSAYRRPSPKRVVISCHSINGRFGPQFSNEDDPDHQFLEASLLVSGIHDNQQFRPGEFAVEKLIASFRGDENGARPDQFHIFKHVAERLGYEVKMVRITESCQYFAKLYFTKPGENDVTSVDARPSDAINVAKRFKAPIYVSKQIVLEDAIRIGYGIGRVRDKKSTCDVLLDYGPDLLIEELNLVRNINLAVKEERYDDAGNKDFSVCLLR